MNGSAVVDRLCTRVAQEITDIKTLVDGSLVMTFGTRCDYCTVIFVPKYGVTEVEHIDVTYCLSLCDCFKDELEVSVPKYKLCTHICHWTNSIIYVMCSKSPS